MIRPGAEWKKEIGKALSKAQAVVLSVSPVFLASEFIYKNELPPLLRAAQKEGLQVLWIHISDSSYTETPIAKYQAVGDPAKPLSLMSEGQQDRVWVKLCTELKNATWGLSIKLDKPTDDAKSRIFEIQGKAIFSPRMSKEESATSLERALHKMNPKLVPFVFHVESDWWAQKMVIPNESGDFVGKVFIGKEGAADVGKSFQVTVCAIDADFPGWQNSSDILPAVRIESNKMTVKRVNQNFTRLNFNHRISKFSSKIKSEPWFGSPTPGSFTVRDPTMGPRESKELDVENFVRGISKALLLNAPIYFGYVVCR